MLRLTLLPYRFLVISLLSAHFLFWSILSPCVPAQRPFPPFMKNPPTPRALEGICQDASSGLRGPSSLVQFPPELHGLWIPSVTLFEVCVGWLSCSWLVGWGVATVTRRPALCVELRASGSTTWRSHRDVERSHDCNLEFVVFS